MRDGITMTDPMPDRTIGDEPPRFGLPRGVIIVLGIAAGVIVLAGIRSVQGILAPIFMAVVLTITVVGWAAALVFMRNYRSRVAYWV